MLVWIFWILDRQVFFGEPLGDLLVLIVIAGLQFVTGYAVGRWWVLLLPVVFLFVAMPLGYPSTNRGEPSPVWWALAGSAPIAIGLLALGVGIHRLGPWRGGLGVR